MYLAFIEEWVVRDHTIKFAVGMEVVWWLEAKKPPIWAPAERLEEVDVQVATIDGKRVLYVPGAVGYLATDDAFRARDRVFFDCGEMGYGTPRGMPATRATVSRIEVVRERHVPSAERERTFLPVEERAQLRDVESCPQRTHWIPTAGTPFVDVGYLVTLDTSTGGIEHSRTYET